MKNLVLVLTVLLSFNAYAGDEMTEAEKEAYLTEVAKEIRKSYWNAGYVDVDSMTLPYSKELLDNHVKRENNIRFHEPLDRDQIVDLYRCHYEPKCEIYLISVTGSYYSGWGEMAHLILLDTMEPRHNSIVHRIYGE